MLNQILDQLKSFDEVEVDVVIKDQDAIVLCFLVCVSNEQEARALLSLVCPTYTVSFKIAD